MASRRAGSTSKAHQARIGNYHISRIALLVVAVVTSIVFFANRAGNAGSSLSIRGLPGDRINVIWPNSMALSQEDTLPYQEKGTNFTSRDHPRILPVDPIDADSEVDNEDNGGKGFQTNTGNAFKYARRQLRLERTDERLERTDDELTGAESMLKSVVQKKESEENANKYTITIPETRPNSDYLVRALQDQIIMAKVYISLAQPYNDSLMSDLKFFSKEAQHVLGEATTDAELPRSAFEEVFKMLGVALMKARERLFDCAAIIKKLRAMVQSGEEQARMLRKQSTFLSQLAAKSIPKGLHCLSLRLMIEYYMLPETERELQGSHKLEDPRLFHYALFSDNVIAASVVVNSTVMNAEEPEKHVFHLVTDKLNFAAIKMWFLLNPPGKAAIEVQSLDDFKWLNSSYSPVLRQLESNNMKEYYFKADVPTNISAGTANMKYRNPKYLSIMNHLRFYLPELYPKLDKILFLDDDVVVQKDLSPIFSINLHGNVNGAVETCRESFHRFNKYINFSNPLISRNFDPNACGWAYGMNIFDLRQWKIHDNTGIYHKWQSLNEDRSLWMLGTLPPGLLTFYNLTHSLDKSWHVLGLGYNPNVDLDQIESASVIHYNGNMKPWLEMSLTKFKPYWTKYVKYDHTFLQQCNINP